MAWVAKRHYLFIACSLLFAALSVLFAKGLGSYLVLLVVAEIILSSGFLLPAKTTPILGSYLKNKTAFVAAMFSMVWVAILWRLATADIKNVFTSTLPPEIILSIVVLLSSLLLLVGAVYLVNRNLFRGIQSSSQETAPLIAAK